MKRLHMIPVLFCVAMAALSGSAAPATSPVVAKLALPYATVLPGVPFEMIVELTNKSDRPVSVGTYANPVFKLPGGKTVTPRAYNAIAKTDGLAYVQLQPGQTVQLPMPLLGNWIYETELTSASSYEISVELRTRSDETDDLPPNCISTTSTAFARLQREVPVGEDADLWARMAATGKWNDGGFESLKEGHQLMLEILSRHLASNYYPYAVLLKSIHRGKDDIVQYVDAAERFPNSPVHPFLIEAASGTAWNVASSADFNGDRRTAEQYYAVAQQLADRALNTGRVGVQAGAERIRSHAAQRLNELRATAK